MKLLILFIVIAISACASKPSRKVIMINCQKTTVEVPQGVIDLCERY